MEISETIKKRIINPEDFLWKKFRPSLLTNLFFSKFFTSIFSDFKNSIDIKSVEWIRDNFNIIIIDKKTGEVLTLIITDNYWNKKCNWLFCTDNICTWVHGVIQNENFKKFLIYFIAKWKSLKFRDFLNILCKDIKAKKEYYQIFWKAERPPFSILHDWGYPLHKFRFLIHEWVMRNMDQSISLNLPEVSIHHSERECQWISPNIKERAYRFLNFPGWFYNHSFDKYYYLTEEEKKEYLEWTNQWAWMWLSTDLSEEDIIMWKWTDKLTELIDFVVKNAPKNNTKVISFNCCCVPRIVWDDIYSVLKRAKEKIDIPFIFQGQLEKTPFEQKIELLEQYIDKIDKNNIKKLKNSISLFWYHENIQQKDLWEELKKFWIKINTSFIPSIDVRLLPLMYKSELFVFSPNSFQKEIFEYPFQSMGTNYITPKYPYSIKYTDDWISSILKELNIDFNKDNIARELKDRYKEYVTYVKDKWYSVWIILIWKKELEKLLTPDYMANIDVVGFLEEMWFKVNLYVYDNFTSQKESQREEAYKESDWDHNEILNIIKWKNKNVNVSFFSNEKWFDDIFKNNKLDLIYSDIYFDDRVTKLWLNQINLKNFYTGYTGAIETIKGLIRLCEMTFYKNYSKYFNK